MLNFTKSSHRSLETFTVGEWKQHVKSSAHHFVNKYEKAIYSKRGMPGVIKFYRQVKDIYFDLQLLLSHINTHSPLINTATCNSCRFDHTHIKKIETDFKRWWPYILRCRDGFKFKNKFRNDCKRLFTEKEFRKLDS